MKAGPLDLSLRGDYTKDYSVPSATEPVAGFAARLSPGIDTVNVNRDSLSNISGGGLSLTGDVDLGGDYTLTSITAWRRLHRLQKQDDDFNPLDQAYHTFDDVSKQTTQEVRLASPSTGPFTWILGGYYFHQKLTSSRPVTLGRDYPIQGTLDDEVLTQTEAFAAFANADVHLLRGLTLNLGLRYTSEHKTLDFVQTGIPGLPYLNLVIPDRFTDRDLSPTVALPHGHFRAEAKRARHDVDELRQLFSVSFEQVCHRLSTLQRPGTSGVPFFFCRVDMAGNITKRHSATRLQFAQLGGACPLWIVHEAVAISDRILVQVAEMPDRVRYVSMAKGLVKSSTSYRRRPRRYAVALGCEVEHAASFVYADGLDVGGRDSATPIGPSCRICPRRDCDQRAFPPAGSVIRVDPDVRRVVPYTFE